MEQAVRLQDCQPFHAPLSILTPRHGSQAPPRCASLTPWALTPLRSSPATSPRPQHTAAQRTSCEGHQNKLWRQAEDTEGEREPQKCAAQAGRQQGDRLLLRSQAEACGRLGALAGRWFGTAAPRGTSGHLVAPAAGRQPVNAARLAGRKQGIVFPQFSQTEGEADPREASSVCSKPRQLLRPRESW